MRSPFLRAVAFCLFGVLGATAALRPGSATELRPAQPAILIDLSDDFLNRLVSETRERKELVSDAVFEVPSQAWMCTSARARAQLVPHPAKALVDLVIDGVSVGRAEGRSAGYRIYSDQTIVFVARKRLWFKTEGFLSAPACAWASTHLKFAGMRSEDNLPVGSLELRQATDEFADKKREAERIASAKAEKRLVDELETQTQVKLVEGNYLYNSRLNAYRALGVDLKVLEGTTTATRMTLKASLASASPPTTPPTLPAPWYFGVRIHESAVNHMVHALLAGRSFPGDRLEEELLRMVLFPEKPAAPLSGKTRITFPPKHAGELRLRPDAVSATVRVAEIVLGEQRFTNIKVHVDVKVYEMDGQKGFGLPDRFEVSSLDSGKEIESKELRVFVQTKILGLISRILAYGDTQPPPAFEKAGPFHFTYLDIVDGWILLGWTRKANAK